MPRTAHNRYMGFMFNNQLQLEGCCSTVSVCSSYIYLSSGRGCIKISGSSVTFLFLFKVDHGVIVIPGVIVVTGLVVPPGLVVEGLVVPPGLVVEGLVVP